MTRILCRRFRFYLASLHSELSRVLIFSFRRASVAFLALQAFFYIFQCLLSPSGALRSTCLPFSEFPLCPLLMSQCHQEAVFVHRDLYQSVSVCFRYLVAVIKLLLGPGVDIYGLLFRFQAKYSPHLSIVVFHSEVYSCD